MNLSRPETCPHSLRQYVLTRRCLPGYCKAEVKPVAIGCSRIANGKYLPASTSKSATRFSNGSVLSVMNKRLFDVLIATVGLILLLPVTLAVAISILIVLGRPVFFTQMRPGLNGKLFRIYKFRTMLGARDASGNLLPDADRLTRFGQFIRSTSLDELPELVNVLLGHMSLVGPRPLLEEYLPLYTPEQARRHDVRPGVTGWAQIQGRNRLSWEEKFQLDTWYVDNQSFWLDLRIIWLTILTVLKRDDVGHAGEPTMPRFKGTST